MSGPGPLKVPDIYITCTEIAKSKMSEPLKALVANACYQVLLREESRHVKYSWDYEVNLFHNPDGWRAEKPRVYMPHVEFLCQRIAQLEQERDRAIEELRKAKRQIAQTLEDLDK